MKIVLKLILVVSGFVLVGCGGGGSKEETPTVNIEENTTTGVKEETPTVNIEENATTALKYKGKTTLADLDENNTQEFISTLNNSYGDMISVPGSGNNKISNKTSFFIQRFDKKTNGNQSGSVDINETALNVLTKKIIVSYKNFNNGDSETIDGKIIYLTTVDEQEHTFVKKMNVKFELLNIQDSDTNITLDGSFDMNVSADGQRKTLTQNFIIKNNLDDTMVKIENLKIVLNENNQKVSFNGKIYFSEVGYVKVSTPVELAYDDSGIPVVGGEILYEGKNATVKERIAYNNRVRVELDNGKDGKIDEVVVYDADTLEIVPNTAPIINISFPQSIFTDTNMSEVKINVYDPDLDGFTTSYEWQINDEVKSNDAVLDNTLFKKHDMLKLTVKATDDRSGDTKTNAQSKEQEVLNSAPKIVLELDKTTVEVGNHIVVDASKSYDVDGDKFTYEWNTQDRAYNVTDNTQDLGTSYLDINESNKSKVLFNGEKINYVSYAAASEIQPYGINIKLNDGDSNGTSEMESQNIIVEAMNIFDSKETIFETADIISGATGDLNSDGLVDVILIVGHPSDKAIRVFLQNADHEFSLASTILLDATAPISYASLSVADMNNDAKNDIVVALGSYGSNGFNVYYQDKDLGTFSKQNYKPTPVSEIPEEEPSVSNIDYLVVGDINKDGKDDVLTVGYSNSFGGTGNNIEIFLQSESNLEHNKTWTIESIDNEFPISYLSLIDADGDSNLDVISKNHILYQENDGTYVHKFHESIDKIVFTDLNSDNNNELIGINGFDNKLFIYKNSDSDKRKYVEDKSKNIFGDSADQLYSADINGDQKKDIIIGHSGLGFFTVYIGKENDFLENQMYWMSGGDALNNEQSILVNDMNNDGNDDVIMFGQDRFEVFYAK
jgi:hypothetical protein